VVLLVVIGILYRSRLQARARERLEVTRTRAREAQIQAIIDSQEKERNRFARDLHDTFGQLISTLNIHIQDVKEREKITREDRLLVFEESSQILDDMYRELKNVCFDLMPQTLIKSGIAHALREFADRVNHTGKFRVNFGEFGLEERLSDLVEVSLYRITQEWVNNILKYSDAKKIDIQLTRDDREITLTIEDDGMGFAKEKLQFGSGNGWKNIISRANLIHGEVELDTLPDRRGTTLILNAVVAPIKEHKYQQQGIES
jgi:signal transduction histidine kinase